LLLQQQKDLEEAASRKLQREHEHEQEHVPVYQYPIRKGERSKTQIWQHQLQVNYEHKHHDYQMQRRTYQNEHKYEELETPPLSNSSRSGDSRDGFNDDSSSDWNEKH
jgi:hypothetical protein